MREIVQLIVTAKDSFRYVCRLGPYKCGQCQRGHIIPRIGKRCKVCKAKVTRIVFSDNSVQE